MKVEFNTTPSQYQSLAKKQQPKRKRIPKPLEPDEVSEFQKELDACMKKWEN